MKRRSNRYLFATIIVILVVGCNANKNEELSKEASEAKRAWEDAQSANTIIAYEEFLRLYPHGEFAISARAKLETMYFELVKESNTIKAYQEFMQLYPKSELIYSKGEAYYFELARRSNNVKDYEGFLKLYPRGEFADEASSLLNRVRPKAEALDFEKAKRINSILAYEEFLRLYPQGKFAREASLRLSKIPKIAKLMIEMPEILQPGEHYKIIFKEVNGISATLKKYSYRLNCDDGSWEPQWIELAESAWIKIEGGGATTFENFVPNEWNHCYSVTSGWFGGSDAYENDIKVNFSYKIKVAKN